MRLFAALLSVAWGWLALGASVWAEPGLQVGFAEVDVSPTLDEKKPIFMAGFGHNRKATAIHDPIMARAVVLSDGKKKIALVSVDVVGLFHPMIEGVRKEIKGFDYVGVSSTHNHEGPDTLGLWGQSPFLSGVDPEYLKKVHNGILKAVQQADMALVPVTAELGRKNFPDLVEDNRQPVVKHDELVAIRFQNSKGPVGVLVQWNCHPELLGSENKQVSADHVATTVAELRKSQKCPVAYFTGTVGGLMTALGLPIKDKKGELLKDGTWEKTEAYGRLVAQATDKVLADAKPVELTPFEIRNRPIVLPVDNHLYKLGWRVGVLNRSIYHWTNNPNETKLEELKDLTKQGAIRTELGYLRLGELEVAIIPGEIYPELVLGKVQDPADPAADFPNAPIEPLIYAQMTRGKHRMIIGLGNDEIGYIIPKRQWDAKAPFCYGLKAEQYGEINSLGPDTAPLITKAFQDLLK